MPQASRSRWPPGRPCCCRAGPHRWLAAATRRAKSGETSACNGLPPAMPSSGCASSATSPQPSGAPVSLMLKPKWRKWRKAAKRQIRPRVLGAKWARVLIGLAHRPPLSPRHPTEKHDPFSPRRGLAQGRQPRCSHRASSRGTPQHQQPSTPDRATQAAAGGKASTGSPRARPGAGWARAPGQAAKARAWGDGGLPPIQNRKAATTWLVCTQQANFLRFFPLSAPDRGPAGRVGQRDLEAPGR